MVEIIISVQHWKCERHARRKTVLHTDRQRPTHRAKHIASHGKIKMFWKRKWNVDEREMESSCSAKEPPDLGESIAKRKCNSSNLVKSYVNKIEFDLFLARDFLRHFPSFGQLTIRYQMYYGFWNWQFQIAVNALCKHFARSKQTDSNEHRFNLKVKQSFCMHFWSLADFSVRARVFVYLLKISEKLIQKPTIYFTGFRTLSTRKSMCNNVNTLVFPSISWNTVRLNWLARLFSHQSVQFLLEIV